LTQNQIINQVNIFISAGISWTTATSESADCAGVSDLYQQTVNTILNISVSRGSVATYFRCRA